MLIFEDLHWIDDATQEFLNMMADSLGITRILLLVNYRPEYSHHWGSKTYYAQLRLDPLRRESAEEMLSGLLGEGEDLQELMRLIIDKTEGTPFFMEEMVQMLIDEGALARNGAVKLTKPLPELKIPSTVQAILTSRIDHLAPDVKELLQTLAVIGREIPRPLIHSMMSKSEEELDTLLDRLQVGEFIYEQPTVDDTAYIFKHALTQEVAYSSLLSERRRAIHERAGRTVEELYVGQLDSHYNALAHHYQSSDNFAKAIEYLLLAGGQAVDRGAYVQGGTNAQVALKLIERLPDGVERLRSELSIRLLDGICVTALRGLASTERLQVFERVCQLSESLNDVPALFRGLLNRGFVLAHRFEVREALEVARRCVKLAEQDLIEMLPAANSLLAQVLHRSGDLVHAASVLRDEMKGLTSPYHEAARLVSSNIWCVNPMTLAYVEHALGRPDAARKLEKEGLRRAREYKHSLSLAAALHTGCHLRYQRQEAGAVRDQAELLIEFAEEHGFSEFLAAGKGYRAWAMAELGQTGPAVIGLEALAALPQRLLLTSKSMMLAKVYLHVGRVEEALTLISEELARIEELGAYQEAAELYRLEGEVILMRDSSAAADAEARYHKAIKIAREQSAKSWELRATTSLARLFGKQGRRNEACLMLTEIYNWFTEGFDTADLKDAKALLDHLS